MFKNVLVGVDGRLGGRDAMALAGRLAEQGATVTLAHVYTGTFTFMAAVDPGVAEEDRREALQMLEGERERAGIEASLAAVQALTTGQGLHELAEEREADLLVLGTSHRGIFGRTVLGNDTRAAINGAPCAIAVAPAGYAGQSGPFATIGVGYDGSTESIAALEAARELAAPTGAKIRALEIVSYPTYIFTGIVPPVGEGIEELVEHADKRMKALPGVQGSAEYGLSGQDLAEFSKEVDLLIVGSRNYGPARRLIVGSTASFLQSHARSPLLVLPRGTSHATPKVAFGETAAAAAGDA
jgi:nucleotide-binding universal stress UspA family protein